MLAAMQGQAEAVRVLLAHPRVAAAGTAYLNAATPYHLGTDAVPDGGRAALHLGAQLSRRQTLSEVFLPLVWFLHPPRSFYLFKLMLPKRLNNDAAA
jgi:hypothetical protein